jgi:two-component system cell cycle sensor histidine kinase/response regulator CckA
VHSSGAIGTLEDPERSTMGESRGKAGADAERDRARARDGEDASGRPRDRAIENERERMAALATLSAGVAHEINNPLTYVKILVGRLASLELGQPADPLSQHRLEIIQDIREGVRRIEQTVRSLRAFTQIDDLEHGPVDVHAALEAALRMTGHEIHHRARLIRDYRDLPPVNGDVARLSQVFLHLLVNAAQAIPEGAPQHNHVDVRTRLSDDGRVAVEIVDSGQGIAPELLPHIFEPFFTTRGVGEGSGLGLSVCKGIVAQLGGELSVTSAPGQGSCFRVLLPTLADGSRDGFGAEVVRRVAACRPSRVLVVDADRQAASLTASVLGERYDVAVVASGREALERLRRERDFDAIVCDLVMPEMTGMELYETVGTLRPELRDRFLFIAEPGALPREAREFLAHTAAPCLPKADVAQGVCDSLASLLLAAATEPPVPPSVYRP